MQTDETGKQSQHRVYKMTDSVWYNVMYIIARVNHNVLSFAFCSKVDTVAFSDEDDFMYI